MSNSSWDRSNSLSNDFNVEILIIIKIFLMIGKVLMVRDMVDLMIDCATELFGVNISIFIA